MSEIIKGRRYRIVETYDSGTTVTYEGVVTDVSNLVVTFDGSDNSIMRAYRKTDPVEHEAMVTVTELATPLPQAPGSVIRYFYDGMDHPEKFQVQIRVPEERLSQHTMLTGSWITQDGSRVADPVGNDWELIYDPEEKR